MIRPEDKHWVVSAERIREEAEFIAAFMRLQRELPAMPYNCQRCGQENDDTILSCDICGKWICFDCLVSSRTGSQLHEECPGCCPDKERKEWEEWMRKEAPDSPALKVGKERYR